MIIETIAAWKSYFPKEVQNTDGTYTYRAYCNNRLKEHNKFKICERDVICIDANDLEDFVNLLQVAGWNITRGALYCPKCIDAGYPNDNVFPVFEVYRNGSDEFLVTDNIGVAMEIIRDELENNLCKDFRVDFTVKVTDMDRDELKAMEDNEFDGWY